MKKGQVIGNYQEIRKNARKIISFNIDKKYLDLLNKEVNDTGIGRSHIINQILKKHYV